MDAASVIEESAAGDEKSREGRSDREINGARRGCRRPGEGRVLGRIEGLGRGRGGEGRCD